MPFNDTTPLLEELPGELWRVAADLIYTSPNGLVYVKVPTGFETDLASVPRVFWSLLPPMGDYGPAAIIHDFLYRFHRESRNREVTRAQADAVLLAAMEELGVGRLTRWTIYCAVRVGAWWAW